MHIDGPKTAPVVLNKPLLNHIFGSAAKIPRKALGPSAERPHRHAQRPSGSAAAVAGTVRDGAEPCEEFAAELAARWGWVTSRRESSNSST